MAVGLAAGIVAAVSAPAAFGGATIQYCGKLIQSGSYCRGGNGSTTVTADTHSYNYNTADYFGGGQQYMCERAVSGGQDPYNPNTGSYSFRCAYLNGSGTFGVDSGGDMVFNCYASNAFIDVYVLNASGSQHTLDGGAKYGSGQGYPC